MQQETAVGSVKSSAGGAISRGYIRKSTSWPFYPGWFLSFLGIPLGSMVPGLIALLLGGLVEPFSKRQLPEVKWKRYWSFALLLGIMAVSSAFSIRKDIAFLSTIGSALLVYLVVIRAGDLLRERWLLDRWLLPILVICGVISSVYVMYLWFGMGIYRAYTVGSGTNGTGTVLIVASALGMSYLERLPGRLKFLTYPYGALLTAATFFTGTRGAWLGCLGMLVVYILRSKKAFFGCLVVTIIFVSTLSLVPSLRPRFQSIFDLDRNMDRFMIWGATLRMIEDNPLIGVGPGVYPFVYSRYKLDADISVSQPFAHNILLQVAAEFGLPGLIVFSGILVWALIQGMGLAVAGDPFYRGVLAALIGSLIHQQFDCTIWSAQIGGIFWLLVGLIVSQPRR